MQFRRSGQRDDRRRRVLIDERVAGQARPAAMKTKTTSARVEPTNMPVAPPAQRKRYMREARRVNQPRVTDFIPKRPETFFLLLVLGAGVIAGLIYLHLRRGPWEAVLGKGTLACFDIGSRGALASWFSAVALGLSSLLAAQIYALRRHREDDYRGRYRVWAWATLIWMFGSIAVVSNIDQAFAGLVVHFTSVTVLEEGLLWWSVLCGGGLFVLGLFLALDVRQCRTSLAALLFAGACQLIATVVEVRGDLAETANVRLLIVMTAATLGSRFLLLMAFAFNARHVYAEAQGRAKRRVRRRRKVKVVEADEEANETEKSVKKRRLRRVKAKPKLKVVADDLGPTTTEAPEPEPEPVEEAKPVRRTKHRATASAASRTATTKRPKTTRKQSAQKARTRHAEPDESPTVSFTEIEDNDELLELETTPANQLTKAQRRRLKKLKRRQLRRAG
jgi:hypothetical protein